MQKQGSERVKKSINHYDLTLLFPLCCGIRSVPASQIGQHQI